jgi:hypothetical protein
MDTFNDAALTPEQIKMLTLQFMGQHLTGELKELDKNLIAKNNTLQGMFIDPTAVINSIPSVPQPQLQQQPAPELTPIPMTAPPSVATLPLIVPAPEVPQNTIDQNQLEFSFETSPLSERIFDTLERIEKKLSYIEVSILELKEFKKKD